jgi:hypothetical protein
MRRILRADQVPGLRRKRHVQADEIRLAQQVLFAPVLEPQFPFHRLRGALHVVVEDPHGESRRAPRHRLADAAHAEDAEGAVMDVVPNQKIDAPLGPLARVHEVVAFHDAAGRRQNQGERQVRGGVGQDVRGIRHQDPLAGGRRHVDVIEADRHVRDRLDAIERRDDVRGELVG